MRYLKPKPYNINGCMTFAKKNTSNGPLTTLFLMKKEELHGPQLPKLVATTIASSCFSSGSKDLVDRFSNDGHLDLMTDYISHRLQ